MFCSAMNNAVLKDALTVFVYHDVSDNPSEFCSSYDLSVSSEIFEYQIKFIRDHFNVIGPDDLLAQGIPSRAALITFDDGLRSYFTTAIPLLEKYHMPSIIFLNAEPVKGGLFWSGLITYLCKKESFVEYVEKRNGSSDSASPLFLSCDRELVKTYLRESGEPVEHTVREYVGEFAFESDLAEASGNPLVYFGNHLYNHDVPLLLSDEELLASYMENETALKKYSNYRNMFSFPFGQPETCFSESQVSLLLHNGADKVFSSIGSINADSSSSYLHRIPLNSFNRTPARIWFQIYNRTLRKQLKILN